MFTRLHSELSINNVTPWLSLFLQLVAIAIAKVMIHQMVQSIHTGEVEAMLGI